MALTIALLADSSKPRNVTGRDRVVYANITGDASYSSGGETLTLANLAVLCPGLGTVVGDWSKVKWFESEVDTSGRKWALDRTNQKLLCFDANSEVDNAVDLSAVTIRVALTYNA